MTSLEERFWSKVNCGTDDECWNWNGAQSHGYGGFRYGNSMPMAHRVAYLLECGKIPPNYQIHHKCENKLCVNPYHLIAVTSQEHLTQYTPNNFAYQRKRMTHCTHGHEFTLENTRFNKNNHRICRECKRLIYRTYYYTHYEQELKRSNEKYKKRRKTEGD